MREGGSIVISNATGKKSRCQKLSGTGLLFFYGATAPVIVAAVEVNAAALAIRLKLYTPVEVKPVTVAPVAPTGSVADPEVVPDQVNV